MNRMNSIVIQYRNTDNRVLRNKLYKEIRAYYYPKLLSIKQDIAHEYWDYVESVYDEYILQTIERWDPERALFTTALYPWVGAVKRTVLDRYMLKNTREAWKDSYDNITKEDFYSDGSDFTDEIHFSNGFDG